MNNMPGMPGQEYNAFGMMGGGKKYKIMNGKKPKKSKDEVITSYTGNRDFFF